MKQSRKTYVRLAGILMILLISASLGYAEVPDTINYQGYLADSMGNPINGFVTMQFSLYTVLTVGTPIWSEIQFNVEVIDGIYNVRLGAVNATLNALPFNVPYYLGVKVGDDQEMTPRQPLTSVAYALRADTSETAFHLSCTGCVEQGMIADSAVTSQKIQNGTILFGDLGANGCGPEQIMKFTGSAWTCAADEKGITTESDPQVGALSEGGWCMSDGAMVHCQQNTPVLTETDPKVGELQDGKWCTSNGTTVNCLEVYPGVSSWSLTGNGETNPAVNFIGTLNPQSFEMRVNNRRALRLEPHDASPNLIGGFMGNNITPGVIGATISGGGENTVENRITDNYGTVGGGKGNMAGDNAGTNIDASHATVGGGRDNTAQGIYATIGGGWGNQVTAHYATIGGGGRTIANEPITGNRVTDDYGTIGGGGYNQVGDNAGTTDDNRFATVGGGDSNTASGASATVGGGSSNEASGHSATVGGGSANTASMDDATVSGGVSNEASGPHATVGGGWGNKAIGYNATVGGGFNNLASGEYATIPGGHSAKASNYGQMAYANGTWAEKGDAQTSVYVLRNSMTTSDAQKELFLDGVSKRITIGPGRIMTFDILVVAKGDYDGMGGYRCLGIIQNYGGNVADYGTHCEDFGEPNITWRVTPDADNDNKALVVKVEGDSANNSRWVAAVRTVELGWPLP